MAEAIRGEQDVFPLRFCLTILSHSLIAQSPPTGLSRSAGTRSFWRSTLVVLCTKLTDCAVGWGALLSMGPGFRTAAAKGAFINPRLKAKVVFCLYSCFRSINRPFNDRILYEYRSVTHKYLWHSLRSKSGQHSLPSQLSALLKTNITILQVGRLSGIISLTHWCSRPFTVTCDVKVSLIRLSLL